MHRPPLAGKKAANLELRKSGKDLLIHSLVDKGSHDYTLVQMEPEAAKLGWKELSGRVIGAAIEVHKALGPGFLESVYEAALCVELELQGIKYERQKPMPISYRGRSVGEHRLDLVIEGVLVVELKAVKALEDIFFATTRSYMKAAQVENGLLLNFATMPLTVKRVGREQKLPIWKSGTQEMTFLIS
jgi:GxxExxY protein